MVLVPGSVWVVLESESRVESLELMLTWAVLKPVSMGDDLALGQN